MIVRSSWQQDLKNSISSVPQLLEFLDLDPETLPWSVDPLFPLRVSQSFAARMRRADPLCPLLQQVLSVPQEYPEGSRDPAAAGLWKKDPLEETLYNPVPGLLHKFKTKVLLTLTGACAIHCRYCFRRHFPYTDNIPALKNISAILEYIQQHPDIHEVILSGGDPLSLPDAALAHYIQAFATLPQLRFLRIHTRFPIVIPARLTDTLGDLLSQSSAAGLTCTMVVHMNHPQEIAPDLSEAFAHFRQYHIPIFNQAVLLKGINDELSVLKALMERCFLELHILPYYIHLLDPVLGAAHFDVDPTRAKELYQGLVDHLPGYLVPRFVREVPGAGGKVDLSMLKI